MNNLSNYTISKALSYTWGDGSAKKELLVNGRRTTVGRNLHDAFLQLRRRNEPVTLWADALCINQQDGAEKTHQIRLMRRIYREAAEVVMWLETPPTETGLRAALRRYLYRT